MKRTAWLIILMAIFAPGQSEAQITCTSGTATNMVAAICGTGISYSNVTLTGDPGSIASFTGGISGGLGSMMNNGVVLSTGFVNTTNALQGSTTKSGFTSGSGIPDLHAIAGSATKDGIILEFDFIPITNQIDVNFQFGSEEYNEFVDDGFNDAFAFFISGPGITGSQNIALVPLTSDPVTINTINNGQAFGCATGPCTNCAYYNDNCSSTYNNAMDGFTTVLTASQIVTPCQTYHIRLMIADGSDDQLDSWVFIQQDGLFSVGNPPLSIDATYPVGTALYEDCANANEVTFTIPAAQASDYSFNVTWGGTATPGADYSSLPTTLTILAGQTSVTIPIDVYSDGLTEGVETITCTYPQSVCANLTATINIDDAPPLSANAGPDASMCNGVGSVTLNASATNALGTVTYSWDNGAGNSASATVSPSTPTIYTVTVTDQCGRTATDQVNVAVGSSPVVDAGTDASVCSGQSATLTASGAASYSWDNGIGAGNGVSVSPTSTTTYTVTGTDAGGCSATDQVTITVNASSAVNAGSDQSVCTGTAVTLSASGAATYSWDNGVSDGTAFTPGTTMTYTVTGTSSGGCQSTDQVIVTVNPLPVVNAGVDQTVCTGQSVTLSGSGASSYSWDNSISDGTAFTPGATMTYTVTGTSSGGCQSTDQVIVTVNPLPVVNAGVDQAVCTGQSVTLSGSGASSYSWNNSVTNGTAFTPGATMTYTVTGTDANGCQSTDQATVTVNSLPVINAGTDQSVCAGGSVTLNGSGGSSYSWNNSVTNGTAFTPVSTQTYTVTGTDGNGCQNTDQAVVTVNSLPAVNAGVDQSVCTGGSVTLNGSGATSYTWNNSVTNGTAFTPSSTQTYTVTGTDASGCQNTDQVVVTVNPLPVVNAGVDQAVCAGGSVTLNGSGATSYTWNNSVTNGTAFTPSSTQTYTVTGTDGNGCQNTDQVVVTVNSIPTVNAGPDQAVCSGQSVTLNGSGTISYSWSNSVSNGVAFVPASTTTYTVTGTSAAGCQNTDQVVVTVNALPVVNAGADQSVCIGGSVTLNGSGATSYTWNNGVTNGTAFTPGSTATYTVTGTNGSGCQGTDQVIVTVNPLPTVNAGADQVICEGTQVSLTGSGATSYTWTNGVNNNQDFTPALGSQTYTVTGTDANGCQNTDQVSVTVVPVPVAGISYSGSLAGLPGLQVTIGNTSSYATSYDWEFRNGNNAQTTLITDSYTETYTVVGVHTVILTASNGICTDTAQLTITITLPPPVIRIPNVFTPDGDNVNDQFFLDLENVADLKVLIVNRWGNVMCEYNGIAGYWDGKTKSGDLADTGTYFYTYELTGVDGTTQAGQGFVELFRK